jgi:hypothetical protein
VTVKVYLKGGAVVRLTHVDEITTRCSTVSGELTSFSWTPKGLPKKAEKLHMVDVGSVAAITTEERE